MGKRLVEGRVFLLQLRKAEPGPGEHIVDIVQLLLQALLQPAHQLHAVHALVEGHAVVIQAVALPESSQGIGPVQLLVGQHPADARHGGHRQRLRQHGHQQQRGKPSFHTPYPYSQPVPGCLLPDRYAFTLEQEEHFPADKQVDVLQILLIALGVDEQRNRRSAHTDPDAAAPTAEFPDTAVMQFADDPGAPFSDFGQFTVQ